MTGFPAGAAARRPRPWLALLLAGIALCGMLATVVGHYPDHYRIIDGDGVGYYAYLPAFFIGHSSSFAGVRAALDRYGYMRAPGDNPYAWTSLVVLPDGRELNFYYAGVALMQLPFFLCAHALAAVGGWPADGFSLPYQFGVAAAGIGCLLLGLFALARLLAPQLAPAAVAGVLLMLVFGTNLFFYASLSATMSHVHSFALIACLLWLSVRWHARPRPGLALAAGLVLGLLALVRPTNLIAGMLFPLCGIDSWQLWRTRLRRHWPHLVLFALGAGMLLAGQVLYYHRQTGEWLLNSYRYAAIVPAQAFVMPRLEVILQVLGGARKGLFFWSPLLLLALPGLIRPPAWLRPHRLALCLLLTAQVLLVSSYFCWSFAGSFGHRAFTDYLGVLALPLAATMQRGRGTRLGRIMFLVAISLVGLNLIQMLQYMRGIILGDNMTWELYRTVFLRLDLPSLYGI